MGEGVKRDPGMAVSLYHSAAESGHADATCALGKCYMTGLGVPLDEAKAFTFFSTAAATGSAAAQRNLALCYKFGTGVKADPAAAAMWLRRSQESGFDKSSSIVTDATTGRSTLTGS